MYQYIENKIIHFDLYLVRFNKNKFLFNECDLKKV
jgi:hypothetical protein